MAGQKDVDRKDALAKEAVSRESKKVHDKTPKKQGWKLALSVILMLMWVGASTIASQLVIGYTMLAILGAEIFAQPVPTAIYSGLSYLLTLFLVIVVPKKMSLGKKTFGKSSAPQVSSSKQEKKSSNRNVLGLRGWPTWTDIGLAPVGFIVYMILAAGVVTFFSLFPWFDAEQAQEVGFSVYGTGIDRMIAFAVLVIVAPIAEEIIFRGWLYGRLREKFGGQMPNWLGMLIAILLVSILFGIVHLQWNVGVNVFAMSVVLCGLREITGTIYAGILMHMLKNGVAFYMLYVLGTA